MHTRPLRNRPAGPRQSAADQRFNANPLYDPTAQLGGAALHRAAHDLVSLEFDPAQAALERASAQASTQGQKLASNASDYYRQLAADEANGVARRKALADELGKRINAAGATAQGQLGDMGKQIGNLAGADQQLTQYGSPRAAEELAAAAKNAAGNQQTDTVFGANESANYGGLADLSGRATALQGGETQKRLLQQLASQMAGFAGQKTDLASKRGAAESAALTKLRQQGFENLVTSEGLGIKRADLQAQTAQDQAANRLAQSRISASDQASRRSNATQRRGQNMTAAQRAADRTSREAIAKARLRYGGRGAKNEPADARKTKNGIGNAQADISTMLRDGVIPPGLRGQIKQVAPDLLRLPMNIDTARKVIVALGAPGLVAQAGAELAKYGGLRQSTLSQLRRLGIRIPKGWVGAFAGPPAP